MELILEKVSTQKSKTGCESANELYVHEEMFFKSMESFLLICVQRNKHCMLLFNQCMIIPIDKAYHEEVP